MHTCWKNKIGIEIKSNRAVFKWLSKNQKQSNYSDQADSATNQSQFLAITCNTLKTREKSRVHGAIGFGFTSHWLKNWRESFKPIIKRSNRNYIITFDSHLKTALKTYEKPLYNRDRVFLWRKRIETNKKKTQ